MSATTETENIVILTEDAANEVRSMQSKNEKDAGKPLRVYVEGGGCSGMKYGMVFDEQRDGDVVREFFGVKLIVDDFSSEYLLGTVVDFKDTLNDGGFKILNPNASETCGCGRSFQSEEGSSEKAGA
ncbi:MAG: iron-sulfur cluster assembly accessory protein [Candidatus Binatia bacterium]|jgi:iron-sulfur cluster assembly accessory protein